jgi:MFS family permease
MRALLQRRDLRLLITGQSLSMFGDWAMIIVLGIWAKVLTGSNAQAGLVFFVFALAGLIAPLGGLVVDRMHKRPLMIATCGSSTPSPRSTVSAATSSRPPARRC